MAGENIRLKNIDETRNYLIEDINWTELNSKKHKNLRTILNYIEHFLVIGCTILAVFQFPLLLSLIRIPIGITSSEIELKIYAIIRVIKRI